MPGYAHLRLDWVTVLTSQEASTIAVLTGCFGHTRISRFISLAQVQELLLRAIFLVVPSSKPKEGETYAWPTMVSVTAFFRGLIEPISGYMVL